MFHFLNLYHRRDLIWRWMKLGTNFFFVQHFAKMKNKKYILCCKIPVFAKKDCQISVFFLKIFTTFGFWFWSSSILLTSFFFLFRHVIKTCCHLMINPSWNASNEATSKNWKKSLLEPTCHYQISNFEHFMQWFILNCDN